MKGTIFILCLFVCLKAKCQQLYFSNNVVFGYNVDVYRSGSLKLDKEGNKYIVGDMQYNFNILNASYNSSVFHNFYLLKLSSDDNMIWLKIIAQGDWNT